jgi:D-inositol-3-phosphate glycosyltransferase
MQKIALLSVHGCPIARLGERDTGGMNVYVLQIARELGRQGHSVDVFTRYHDPADAQIDELGDNARVIHLKAGPYFDTKESQYHHIPEFLSSLYSFQQAEGASYDIVHSHYWLSGYAGIEVSRRWDVPHVTTFHTLARTKLEARADEVESQLRISAESEVMNKVDGIVVTTAEERDDLGRLYQVPREKVHVIPAGVDLALFRPVDKAVARRSLGLTEKRVILSVGRIQPFKGLELLISSVARLQDTNDTRLIIVGGTVGGDRELERLRVTAAESGILDMVTFAGPVSQSKLPQYYSAADVFVMPSYHESFGLAALEAMACGTPVVASRVGGLKSFIRHGETGYLIPWRSPELFAERLDMLLADPVTIERVGMAARSKALTMGWSAATRRLQDYYVSLTGEPLGRLAGA